MRELYRVARYVIVGLLNTVFGYGLYCVLLVAGASLWLAVTGCTILGVLFNFYTYGGLVFGGASHKVLPRFMMFYVVLGGLNFLALRAATASGLNSFLAQAVVLPFIAAAGYFGMGSFVFRSQALDIRAVLEQPSEPPML